MMRVVCVGTVTVDLVFDIAEPALKPQKYRAETSRLVTGGGALIAARAIARLGGAAHLAGAVGDDAFADLIAAEMAAAGVATDLLTRRDGVPTARSAVLVTPDGERTIVNHRDDRLHQGGLALDVTLGGFPFDAALADTRWPGGAAQVLHAARDAGRPGVVDAEAPVAIAAEALALASHVAFSEQGLHDYTGESDPHRGLVAASARLGWVCVTRGPEPVLWHDDTGLFEVAVPQVTAVDTLGAGDVWHGAFALALAEGRPDREAIVRANAAAALKASARGLGTALPDRDTLESFLTETTT